LGKPDTFYFSNDGYQYPSGDHDWSWSSSLVANLSGNAYDFNEYTGAIGSDDMASKLVVARCSSAH
jgi:hypothetical protein